MLSCSFVGSHPVYFDTTPTYLRMSFFASLPTTLFGYSCGMSEVSYLSLSPFIFFSVAVSVRSISSRLSSASSSFVTAVAFLITSSPCLITVSSSVASSRVAISVSSISGFSILALATFLFCSIAYLTASSLFSNDPTTCSVPAILTSVLPSLNLDSGATSFSTSGCTPCTGSASSGAAFPSVAPAAGLASLGCSLGFSSLFGVLPRSTVEVFIFSSGLIGASIPKSSFNLALSALM